MFFLKQLKQLKNQKQGLIMLVLTKQAPTDLRSDFKAISVVLKKVDLGSYKHTLNTTLLHHNHTFLTTSSHVICPRGFFLPFAFPSTPPQIFSATTPPPPAKKKKQKKNRPPAGAFNFTHAATPPVRDDHRQNKKKIHITATTPPPPKIKKNKKFFYFLILPTPPSPNEVRPPP